MSVLENFNVKNSAEEMASIFMKTGKNFSENDYA